MHYGKMIQLIKSFRLICKLVLCVGAGLELNSAGLRPEFDTPDVHPSRKWVPPKW